MTLTADERTTSPSRLAAVAPAASPGLAEVVVVVDGELDSASVSRVREHLHDALSVRPQRLVVDLTDCPFVDACALTMLLDVHRRAWRAGGVLSLRGCSPRVLRLLSLTGLRRVFDLTD